MLQYVRTLVLAWAILAAAGCQRSADVPISSSSVQTEHEPNRPLVSPQPTALTDAVVGDGGNLQKPADATPRFIRPFPVVMYDSKHQEVLAPYAKRVAELIGAKIVQASPRNPVCCVWLELTGWLPNPGTPGYVMINQAGGSIIQASDEEQMRRAIAALESLAQRQGDFVEVPNGLLTNYEFSPQPKDTEPGVGPDSR